MARNKKYRVVAEQIEEARRSGAEDLNLSNSLYEVDADGLPELLESLSQLTQLQSLDLSANELTSLPESLTKAISEIMENRQLESDKGEITLQRMESIWEAKQYGGMFPTFHDCMKNSNCATTLKTPAAVVSCHCALATRSQRYPGQRIMG